MPGSRWTSSTVAVRLRGGRATVTAQRHPRYAGEVQSKEWVPTRSPSGSKPWCSPTVPGSAISSAAARARSTAAVRTSSS